MSPGRSPNAICGSHRSIWRSGLDRSVARRCSGVDDDHRLLALAVGDVDSVALAADLFAGWWQLIEKLGAVPRVLVWDGEGAIGRWRGGKVELTGECQAFRGTLGAKVMVCKPGDPEAKGLIERCSRLFGAVVSARSGIRLTGGLQRPTAAVDLR